VSVKLDAHGKCEREGGWDSSRAILRSREVKDDAMAEIRCVTSASVYKLLSSVHPVSLSVVRLVAGVFSPSLFCLLSSQR